MQLLTLEVQNWVHHRYRKCDFTRGLVGILGENGSGKSSLFGAISWLLTGENPNFGVKLDNISQYAKPGEPSFASLEFEHNGHYAVVTRHLLPEKEQSVLLVDNVEVARGDKSVTAGIEKLLGVDAKFISRFIIVPQTEIFSFIDDTKTDTDKFFQRLFNTTIADKCQDVIGKKLAKTNIPEIPVSSGQWRAQLDLISQEYADSCAAVDSLPAFDSFLAQQEEEQNKIALWQKRQSLAQELLTAEQNERRKLAQHDERVAALTEHENDLSTFSAAASGGEAEHRDAKIALGHWENYKKISALRETLNRRRKEIAAAREGNPKPASIGDLSSAEMRRDIHGVEAALVAAREFVAVFDADGVVECPTCHTPAENLATQVANQKSAISVMEALLVEKKKQLSAILLAEHALTDWEKLQSKLDAQEAEIVASEETLTAVKPPQQTETELQQTVSDFEAFDAALNELRPLIDATKEELARLRGEIKSIQDRCAQLREEISAIPVTEADAHLATKRLAAIRDAVIKRGELEERRLKLQYEKDLQQKQYEAALKQETDAAATRRWLAVAETARAALKNAPRLVAQRNLKKLESSINELLQIFGVNFFVTVADDDAPTFVAEFYDGRRQTAQRLSIGQKTVLALAFRVAVNAQFAEEIGLLALDEPTAALDTPRIKALAPVLEKLRDLSTTKGLQCLLVTHATTLSHLFESTIELEPPELRHVNAG